MNSAVRIQRERDYLNRWVKAVHFTRRNSSIDDNETVPPGTIGKVTMVDDVGTLGMVWENGSTLGVLVEDTVEIVVYVPNVVLEADGEFRSPSGLPDSWTAQDWLSGVAVSLGMAARAAGEGEADLFVRHMAGMVAIGLHALEQAEAGSITMKELP